MPRTMKFIEMTGKQLRDIIHDDPRMLADLQNAGVQDDTILRINQQGDIEVRRPRQWDVIGGLLGNYLDRVRHLTGLDFA